MYQNCLYLLLNFNNQVIKYHKHLRIIVKLLIINKETQEDNIYIYSSS